ncbi:MAG TPA: MBL fold metallo-hydrolase [Burkholderiaceae bacterium]
MLRFTSLGSGSSGNATLVESLSSDEGRCPTRVLIDCGLAPRQLAARLALRGLLVADIDAVFVTHEHSDHVGGVIALERRHGMPVWASAGTWQRATARLPRAPAHCVARDGEPIAVGAITLWPFAVPHDAAEPLQLTCSDSAHRIGILTDLGEPTDAIARALQGCDALLLEANHDRSLLTSGAYPAWLKRRIGGDRGHLANSQSASLLDACRHAALQHVVAAHLSQQNNRPELALAALRGALGSATTCLSVADAAHGCDWIEID